MLDRTAWSPYTGICGLYPAYEAWCHESGYRALGRNNFVAELARVVPHFRKTDSKQKNADGVRKTVRGAYGVYVSPDPDSGGEVAHSGSSDNEDLL